MKQKHIEEIRKVWPYGEIYLNGSRHMLPLVGVGIPEGTDYDYAIDRVNTYEISQFFRFGWKEVLTESYKDANTSCVFEKQIAGDKVQVMSRIDLEEYKYAFERIKPKDYYEMWRLKQRDKLTQALEEGYREYQTDINVPF